MTHYDTILVGATALALGYAHRAEAEGRHCAVIEAGCICMPEVSAAWSGEAYMPQHRYSDETEPFVREMERRGIFREKQPAYPEMGPLAPNGLIIPAVMFGFFPGSQRYPGKLTFGS